jgi:hypothetical protein
VRVQIRPKWMVRSIAAFVVALVGIASDAAPQQAQAEPKSGGSGTSIYDLRKRGFDIVLVIDGTGSMKLIVDDVKAKVPQLMSSIHRLVPIARIGIIVFGDKGEEMRFQPLTLSSEKLVVFLNTIHAMGGANVEEDTFGACRKAIEGMDWKPYAKKVVVLIGDSPPHKEDFNPLRAMIRKFKDNNGTFNAVDVAEVEHERFERDYWLKKHREEPAKLSPLPEFYRQTAAVYRVLAAAGGGEMRELRRDESIDQVLSKLIFLGLRPWRPGPLIYATNCDRTR